MKYIFLTSLTMLAFAANSIFNRLSLAEGEIGPAGFALVRILSGAAILLLLVSATAKPNPQKTTVNLISVFALAAYILGFSFAYVTLDTGIGALILFGGVQITMFVGAFFAQEQITPQRWFGSALAFFGLVWLLAPSEVSLGGSPSVSGTILMVSAAIGWGIYSLIGRKSKIPLRDTQRSFLFAVPLIALVWFVFPDQIEMSQRGIILAVLSGAITSGLGYALWYFVLPKLDTITASVAQLTVPAIAMIGGILFLNEPITIRFFVSACLIMSGVVIAVKK